MTIDPSSSFPKGLELPSLAGIQAAHARIKRVLPCILSQLRPSQLIRLTRPFLRQYIHRTPLHASQTLNERATAALDGLTTADGRKVRIEVALKCENLQVCLQPSPPYEERAAWTESCGPLSAYRCLQDPRGSQRHSPLSRLLDVDRPSHPVHALFRQPRSSCPSSRAFSDPTTQLLNPIAVACLQIALTAKLLSTPERPISATIIMPSNASKAKKAGVVGYGATIVECSPDTRARQVTTDLEMEKVRFASSHSLDCVLAEVTDGTSSPIPGPKRRGPRPLHLPFRPHRRSPRSRNNHRRGFFPDRRRLGTRQRAGCRHDACGRRGFVERGERRVEGVLEGRQGCWRRACWSVQPSSCVGITS